MTRRYALPLILPILIGALLGSQPAQAQSSPSNSPTGDAIGHMAGSSWNGLALVGQRKSARQLTCRYARTGQNRRQLLMQEAVAVFRVPAGKSKTLTCPQPSPGRTSLARLATSLRNHPTMGKLLVRVSVLPIRQR